MKLKGEINFSKHLFWAVVTLLVISVTFSLFFQTGKAPLEFSISDLVGKINKGEVERIIVRGDSLFIDLKNQDKAVAKKESEAGLTETLKNYGVDSRALQAVNLEVKDPSGLRFWAELLIPVLLPMIISGNKTGIK